ncbi:hypothetical protein SCUP234_07955 [Seiridium cupressi]
MSIDHEAKKTTQVGTEMASAEPQLQSLGSVGDQYLLPYEALERTLRGLVVAIKLDDERRDRIQGWLSQQQNILESRPLSANQWLEATKSQFSDDTELYVLTNLIIGISYMRERGRHSNESQDTLSLNFIWPLVYAALAHTTSLFKPSRSAAGFIFVPLCSLIKDGGIDELWRLHVWLPDGVRGALGFKVHGHNAYGQSWILAGEGTNHRWTVEPAADKEAATHAEYRVEWNDGKKQDSSYKTHQVSSTVKNSHTYFKATHLGTDIETRDMTYTVSHEEWHSSDVAPEVVFATLFFFDAHRGFNKDAKILGPKDQESSTQLRDPAGHTPEKLVKTVELMRKWEDLLTAVGNKPTTTERYVEVLDNINDAKLLCESAPDFPNREYYKEKTMSEFQRAQVVSF